MVKYTYGNLAEKSSEAKHSSPTDSAFYSRRRKKEKIQLNTKWRARCLFLVILISAMGMFITFRNGLAARQGYDLVKAKQSVATLEKENARLHLDIASLKSPERIRSIAVGKLGMILPPQVYFADKKR
ncbi:cell division protein FtsL [Pectinatus frisingensis]|jgi:cell division protein FtsL|uniref:cell division protein FtsL n=1 Tax=Pectinatus frisingensis TaxID=865 RepID=UPI0018C60AC7|nr:cell division protein FtsL [Pectinatus frisingensis]